MSVTAPLGRFFTPTPKHHSRDANLFRAADPVGGTAALRKLMLLLLGVRTRGRRFDSDLVHHAFLGNRPLRCSADASPLTHAHNLRLSMDSSETCS